MAPKGVNNATTGSHRITGNFKEEEGLAYPLLLAREETIVECTLTQPLFNLHVGTCALHTGREIHEMGWDHILNGTPQNVWHFILGDASCDTLYPDTKGKQCDQRMVNLKPLQASGLEP